MTRLKILFINFLLFLTSRAKSFKESNIDNDYTSHIIKVPSSGQDNDKESITIYIKNDDILSISEFNKLYNPEEHHFTDFRFIKDTDSDNVKKVISKNNETKLDVVKLAEHNEENKTDRNVDATAITEKRRKSKSEELSTESNDIESMTINIKGQGENGDFIEDYRDDLEVPENFESTEGYFNIAVSNDDSNSAMLDDIMTLIPSRRSLFQSDALLLDYKGRTSNTPVEIVQVDQNTVPKSEIISSKDINGQSLIASNSWTPSVAPPLMNPYPHITQRQLPDQSQHLSFTKTFPKTFSREVSNQNNINFGLAKMIPDENEPSSNLDKSGQIWTNEKSIDDFNSNIYENAYPYTPPNIKSVSQQQLTKEPNFNTLYSKLTQASEHPLRNSVTVDENFGNYGIIRPYFNLNNPYLQNFGPYNFGPRTRRLLSCKNCGHY